MKERQEQQSPTPQPQQQTLLDQQPQQQPLPPEVEVKQKQKSSIQKEPQQKDNENREPEQGMPWNKTDVLIPPPDPDPGFPQMEQEIRKTLAQMMRRQGTNTYTNEMKRMLDVIIDYHNQKQRLMSACKALTERVQSDLAQIASLAEEARVAKLTTERYKEDVEKAWTEVDASAVREHSLQEKVESLQLQLAKVTEELELKTRLALDQGEDYGMMMKNREAQAKEKEKLTKEIRNLREQVKRAAETREEVEVQLAAANTKIAEVNSALDEKTNEMWKEIRLKNRQVEETENLKAKLERTTSSKAALSLRFVQTSKKCSKFETQLKEYKAINERILRENECLSSRLAQIQTELHSVSAGASKAMEDSKRYSTQIKDRERELIALRSTLGRAKRRRDAAEKRAQLAIEKRDECQARFDNLQDALRDSEVSAKYLEKKAEADGNALKILGHQRTDLTRRLHKTTVTLNEKIKELEEVKQQNEEINFKVAKLIQQLDELKLKNKNLLMEHERLIQNTSKTKERLEECQSEHQHYKKLLAKSTRQLAEAHTEINELRQIAEKLKEEGSKLQNQSTEAEFAAKNLEEKLELSKRQIDQLKGEVSSREIMVFTANGECKKLENEQEKLRFQNSYLQKLVNTLKNNLSEENTDKKELQRNGAKLEEQLKALRIQFEQIEDKKEILSKNLFQRNEDVSKLREKVRVLEDILHNGERHYNDRVYDINLLKTEIKRLRSQNRNLEAELRNTANVRLELFQTTRTLTHYQVQCRAFSDEMRSPLNMHRWRCLSGQDPNRMQLLIKVQLLQKRILAMAEKDIQQDDSADSKKSEETHEALSPLQLHQLQRKLFERKRRIKSLKAEIVLYQRKAEEQKSECVLSVRQTEELKRKYFIVKKREERLRSAAIAAAAAASASDGCGFSRLLLRRGYHSAAFPLPVERESLISHA